MIGENKVDSIERFWLRYRNTLLWVAVFLMILASAHRLTNEFQRLLFDQSEAGAIDLKFRHNDVGRWFGGLPVYEDKDAIYPPASYLMLWPLLGWLTLDHARWLWAVTSVAAMVWLMILMVKESHAEGLSQRLFIAMLVPSIYATGATIGNGQLIVHLLPFLITAMLLIQKKDSWANDILATLFFLVALVKPAIAAPFFWILLLFPRRLRPVILTIIGYSVLTILAIIPQNFALGSLISDWLARGSAAAVRGGYANLHSWLALLGFQEWILPASLILLVAMGLWIFRHRHAGVWLLMGVTAYFARFWVYHRLYDDFLVLVPMVSLFQIARQHSTASHRVCAGVILGINWAAALAPARILSFGAPFNILFEALQVTVWLIGLVFLIYMTGKEEPQQMDLAIRSSSQS